MKTLGEWHSAGLTEKDVTPEDVWLSRKDFLARAGLAAAALFVPKFVLGKDYANGEKPNPESDVTTYNNFYEFGSSKDDPHKNAGSLKTRPWTVKVEGLCKKPKTWDVDALMKKFPSEERIYRLRCVEAWSVVVPWQGFALSALIKAAEPSPKAKYVAFETFFDPKMAKWQESDLLPWPYREGLRMDEALHPLAILATGMYGKPLPNQNGAPLRLVVPWKYGFKSIKSIVKIKFVDKEPQTTWNMLAPQEYGFYSNVNPEVDHPRWSQASERRLGELRRRKTLMFNGYGDQVAGLYKDLDLKKNF